MSKTNSTIPTITIPDGMLKVESHDKYGDSLVMEGNTVMLNGKLHRITTFKLYEKVKVDGRTASVTIPKIAFREVEADVPNVPSNLTTVKGKNGKPETFKTSEVAKNEKSPSDARLDKLEAMFSQLMATVAAK